MLIRKVLLILILTILVVFVSQSIEKYNSLNDMKINGAKTIKDTLGQKDRFVRLKKALQNKLDGKKEDQELFTVTEKEAEQEIQKAIQEIQDNKFFNVTIDSIKKTSQFINVAETNLTVTLVNGKGILDINDYQKMLKDQLSKKLYIANQEIIDKKYIKYKAYYKKEIGE